MKVTTESEVVDHTEDQKPDTPTPQMQDAVGLSEALSLLARHLDPNAQAEAQVKAQKRENQFPPRISALNPQGDKDYPRPKLPYRKIFVPYEAEPSDFTYEELELMSRLKTGTYTIKRNDRSTAEIVVEITKNAISGEPENLHIVSEIGFNNENRHLMPPMADYLRQILGEDASDIMTMDDRQRFVLEGALAVSVGQ